MPTTVTHKIYYPAGTAVPNIPVQMQTSAESAEAALDRITKTPVIICDKTGTQFNSDTVGTYVDVTWNTEIVKQGITHVANSANFVVTESGIYQVNIRVSYNDPYASGSIIVNVNGVDRKNTLTDAKGVPESFAKPLCIAPLKLVAGDIVKVRSKSNLSRCLILGDECNFQLNKLAVY